MFNFYLNNTLVEDPINWDDFEENIVRDDVINGLLPRYDIKLKFIGSGYEYLYNTTYLNGGYCQLVPLRIDILKDGNYVQYFTGYIFISDCIFFRNKGIVECTVIDDNFGARIYNNKSIKTYLDTGKSKNGLTIDSVVQQSMQLFDPQAVSYLPDERNIIFFYDAFKFLVDFMTDGLVGFESNYLDYNTLTNVKADQANKIGIASGKEIRTFTHNITPFISFDELFTEVNRKFPIMFTIIKGTDGRPTIKIENEDYFTSQDSVLTINNIADLRQSFDNVKLYANIKFDSTYKDYDGTMYSFPQTRFLGFLKEEYFFVSECNTDNALDLTAKWIADSNIIEGLVSTDTTNTSYDTDTIFIEGAPLTPTTLAYAAFSPVTGANPWYYNQHLQNNFIAERYTLASSIALYLNNQNDGFMASSTSNEVFVAVGAPVGISIATPFESTPIAFQDDSTPPNHDVNGNYDNTLYRYTAPSNGVYTFEVSLDFDIALFTAYNCDVYFRYDVYDASDVLQYSYYSSTVVNFPPAGPYTGHLVSVDGFFMPATYYTIVRAGVVPVQDNPFNELAQFTGFTGSYFKTVSTENGGGIYAEGSPANYYVSRFNFDFDLSNESYEAIKLDLSGAININIDGISNSKCFIRKIDRKLSSGATKFELISNINNSN